MKKLVTLMMILSAISMNAYAGSHSKKADVSKADYLKQAEATFNKMDSNKDGILTAVEKKEYYAKAKAAREAAKKAKDAKKAK